MREFCKRKTPEQRKRIASEPFDLPLPKSGKLYTSRAPLLGMFVCDHYRILWPTPVRKDVVRSG